MAFSVPGCRSLARLGLAYVDCYLIHNPKGGKILETCPQSHHTRPHRLQFFYCLRSLRTQVGLNVAGDAMLELKAKGKAKSVGVSNFGIEQLQGLKAA
jgi:diketogulonate reductase-like aldo/keto reductase